ncbi:MAG: hypothetical protein ACFB03_19465 [Paracoccaceae bacterium]
MDINSQSQLNVAVTRTSAMDPTYLMLGEDLLLRVFMLADLGHRAEDIAESLRLPTNLVRAMMLDADIDELA